MNGSAESWIYSFIHLFIFKKSAKNKLKSRILMADFENNRRMKL